VTPSERAAIRLVIEAFRLVLKATYREDEPGNTGNRAMQLLDNADDVFKPPGDRRREKKDAV